MPEQHRDGECTNCPLLEAHVSAACPLLEAHVSAADQRADRLAVDFQNEIAWLKQRIEELEDDLFVYEKFDKGET